MLILYIRCMIIHRIDINHQECLFGRHAALGRRCSTKWLNFWFCFLDRSILFLISRFKKWIVSTRSKKYSLGLFAFWSYLRDKILIWLYSSLSGSTLHPTHCTVYNMHSTCKCKFTCICTCTLILHIEHCSLHVINLY